MEWEKMRDKKRSDYEKVGELINRIEYDGVCTNVKIYQVIKKDLETGKREILLTLANREEAETYVTNGNRDDKNRNDKRTALYYVDERTLFL
jgi:hypothetical protein